MMNLSKQLKSQDMIKFAQIFCQQPRNSVRLSLLLTLYEPYPYPPFKPNSLSVVYCQQAPSNAELNGLFQCQFQGVDPNNFTNGEKVGAAGTVPFGQNSPLNPPGSCPANPSGPITAGAQLVDLVSSPGVPSSSSPGSSDNSTAQAPSPSPTPAVKGADAAGPTPSPSDSPAPSPSASPSSSGSGGFKAQNGRDAQQLNEQFKTLTADSTCTGKVYYGVFSFRTVVD